MKTTEQIMENLISYLYQTIHQMLELVIIEEYEKAAELRDEIEFYILSTCKYLEYYKLTNINISDIYENISDLKMSIISEVSEMLKIPDESRIVLDEQKM